MLAYKDGVQVRLISRTGIDHIRRYPDLAAALARRPVPTAVLDGGFHSGKQLSTRALT